jgi:circadian clock protein KaiC
MNKTRPPQRPTDRIPLERTPTGVSGIDEIMEGGLPKGRSTLLRGEAGSGKTLLAVEEITGNCQMLPDAAL